MAYILMMFIYTSAGIEVRTAEFATRETCEAAKEVVLSHIGKSGPPKREVATCVPK